MKDDRIISEVEDRVPETSTKRRAKLVAERIPVYKQQALTYLEQEPGFKYRYVNDRPGRIQKFLRAGWELVKGDVADTYTGKGRSEASTQGSHIERITNPNGLHKNDILMRIPLDIYLEDQKEKEKQLDASEEDIDPTGQLRRARKLSSKFNNT